MNACSEVDEITVARTSEGLRTRYEQGLWQNVTWHNMQLGAYRLADVVREQDILRKCWQIMEQPQRRMRSGILQRPAAVPVMPHDQCCLQTGMRILSQAAQPSQLLYSQSVGGGTMIC